MKYPETIVKQTIVVTENYFKVVEQKYDLLIGANNNVFYKNGDEKIDVKTIDFNEINEHPRIKNTFFVVTFNVFSYLVDAKENEKRLINQVDNYLKIMYRDLDNLKDNFLKHY